MVVDATRAEMEASRATLDVGVNVHNGKLCGLAMRDQFGLTSVEELLEMVDVARNAAKRLGEAVANK